MITNVSAWFGASSSVPSSGWPCSVRTSFTSWNESSARRVSRSTSRAAFQRHRAGHRDGDEVHDLLLGAPGLPLALGLHDHERLGLVRRLVVGAVLRVALLGQDVLHLLEGEQREARLAQHLGAALQRDGARHRDGDVDVAFVHLGQELGPQPRHQRHRQRQHADAGDRRPERVAQRHPQQRSGSARAASAGTPALARTPCGASAAPRSAPGRRSS